MTLIRSLLAVLAASAAVVSATVVEQVDVLPDGWKQLSEAPDPNEQIRLTIALHQPAIDDLASHITSRAKLSLADIQGLQDVDAEDLDAVKQWLSKNGVTSIKAANGYVHAQTTVKQAESMLDMDLERFAFEDKPAVLRTRRYSVPEALASAIKFVHPIANFMTPKTKLSRRVSQPGERSLDERADSSPCASMVTPSCIQELYNIHYDAPEGKSPTRFGIVGFLEEYANYADAQLFLDRTSPSVASAGYNFSVELINGGENSQDPREAGNEAALDMDYALALGYPTDITFYSTGGRGDQYDEQGKAISGEAVTNEPYLELLQDLLDKPDSEIPHVLSISYADDELSVPRPYANKVCSLIGMLTARGTSVLSGSGDGGARGAREANCTAFDGSGKQMTVSSFPASCPWVTSVGAVNNAGPLEGAHYSSGGFSSYFPRPTWQNDAVDSYIAELDGHLQGYYNSSMRAVPDVSAVGSSFLVIIAGQPAFLEGTSASTPVFASIIALINDARMRKGKGPLGWLNDRLYSPKVQAALQDVTGGISDSCTFTGGKQPGGWPAAKGYDTITGLGVPRDFEELLGVFMDM